jgi:hypothetical protein
MDPVICATDGLVFGQAMGCNKLKPFPPWKILLSATGRRKAGCWRGKILSRQSLRDGWTLGPAIGYCLLLIFNMDMDHSTSAKEESKSLAMAFGYFRRDWWNNFLKSVFGVLGVLSFVWTIEKAAVILPKFTTLNLQNATIPSPYSLKCTQTNPLWFTIGM